MGILAQELRKLLVMQWDNAVCGSLKFFKWCRLKDVRYSVMYIYGMCKFLWDGRKWQVCKFLWD